jgi:uncharacterized protein YyaL (SSP411 family)
MIVGVCILGAIVGILTVIGTKKTSPSNGQSYNQQTASTFVQQKMSEGKKPNRLIHEKSPYLLQHAFNPVDWYPWGNEAFAKARSENKPIFLSIGYSTCYWCHVMEREVFEDTAIARLMNEKLVCIKVDREERPDIDRVYMTAVQALTGSGGWPMSVFLTGDLKPFFGGTYIPPRTQYGRPGFPDLVNRISDLWKHDHAKITESSEQIAEYLKTDTTSSASVPINEAVLDTAFNQFQSHYDPTYGGFGPGPKFPRPATFNFLLRYYARTKQQSALQMTLTTLRKMAEGGMYDQIGDGFHRYSVDEQWRVPHFEKMLYDQAQLAVSYLEAYQITHDEFYADVTKGILNYVISNLRDTNGGFYSAEDAESALDATKPDGKEEGACYVWTKSEILQHLGKNDGEFFSYYYGIEDSGNALHDPQHVFMGKNILYVAHTIEEAVTKFTLKREDAHHIISEGRKKLFALREQKPKPHLDDKIITAWNGLAISAFAKAYQVLDEKRYLECAEQAAEFMMTKLFGVKTQSLYRRYRDGESRFEGTLQDYAFLSQGLLDLYEASFQIRWLDDAIMLTKRQNELFRDTDHGGFFDITGNDPSILMKTKEEYDGAEPTGNSIAALNLFRLAQITDNKEWRSVAEKTVAAFGAKLQRMPEAAPQMLAAADWNLSTPKEIVIAGKFEASDTKMMLQEIHAHFLPYKIVIFADGGDGQKRLASFLPFIEGMRMIDGKATAYICENYACQLPTSDLSAIAKLLQSSR